MLAENQGSPPFLCPGTSQVQESMCRSLEPGQNTANISSWEKACGTHPTGWERPKHQQKHSGWRQVAVSAFLLLWRAVAGGRVEGREVVSGFAVGQCIGVLRGCFCIQQHQGGEGACTHSQWYPEIPVSSHLLTHVLSPAHPRPCMGHWCWWGLICPSADESAGTFLWWIYCLVCCGLVVIFFFFKRNKNEKQESQKALNLYLFKVETLPQQDIMACCGGGGLPESLEIYVMRNTIPAKNIVKSFQNFSYKPFYC